MESTFENACNNVGLPETKRQLKKWLRGFGLAFKFKDQKLIGMDAQERKRIALEISNTI